jgi:exosortase J
MAAPALFRVSPRPVKPYDPALNQATDWLLLCAIFVVSIMGLWWMLGSQVVFLWNLWTHNGLASIGLLIPVAVVVLTIRVWYRRPLEQYGSWWGLAVCVVALLLATLDKAHRLPFLTYHGMSLHLFSTGLRVYLYVIAVVLFFAGFRHYRAALFPIALLLFLNPAPGFFTTMIDLPLQYAGAHIARGFAHWIGLPLTIDNLRIMFSPALGMFMAPGCNGLRGALAMGFLAAVFGHLYALPWLVRDAYVVSGVAFAYLLNLVRLCGLVLCYRVALDFAPLAAHMTALDYVLGSTLFLFSAFFVLGLPRRWKRLSNERKNSQPSRQ